MTATTDSNTGAACSSGAGRSPVSGPVGAVCRLSARHLPALVPLFRATESDSRSAGSPIEAALTDPKAGDFESPPPGPPVAGCVDVFAHRDYLDHDVRFSSWRFEVDDDLAFKIANHPGPFTP